RSIAPDQKMFAARRAHDLQADHIVLVGGESCHRRRQVLASRHPCSTMRNHLPHERRAGLFLWCMHHGSCSFPETKREETRSWLALGASERSGATETFSSLSWWSVRSCEDISSWGVQVLVGTATPLVC